jgi:hypothetical protein
MLMSSTGTGEPVTDADGLSCLQARQARDGAPDSVYFTCGQARLSRDDPTSPDLRCAQALRVARLSENEPAWWDDPYAKWGDVGYDWDGAALTRPEPHR